MNLQLDENIQTITSQYIRDGTNHLTFTHLEGENIVNVIVKAFKKREEEFDHVSLTDQRLMDKYSIIQKLHVS